MVKPRTNVRFVLDEQIVELDDVPPTLTVLDYLRETCGRTGTKEGCAEGDCGACTVVLGELAPDRTRIVYRAINSCIRFLPTLDGKELVTVESLQSSRTSLHPVQQAMVDHHGSQCGFCTPGFVMSLFSLYMHSEIASREDVISALSGNLCRCTGYKPIVAAGCAMSEYPSPSKWSREDAQSAARIARLREVQSEQPLASRGFHAPTSLEELSRLFAAEPNSLLLAGGTDIGLWVTKHLRDLPPIIYLGAVSELKEITELRDGVRIGAGVPLSEAWPAIIQRHPQLRDVALRFASPPVCNSGTLCGNIVNGSPIGDSMPILIALGAELELRAGEQTRRVPLDQFYVGYQRTDLRPGELIVAVTVPKARAGQYISSYKVSKRYDQDISAVCAGFAVTLNGSRVTAARLAFGGMAAVPARARKAEAALLNREWHERTIASAIDALTEDFQPLTDLRASSEYRMLTAGHLLRRFYRESLGKSDRSLRNLKPVTELS